jgi:hypothetical protein
MTTDQLVSLNGGGASLLAAIAAMISARGTFLTIKQMQQQTQASFRPVLIFAGSWIKVQLDIAEWAMKSPWKKSDLKELPTSGDVMHSPLGVVIRNAGLGSYKCRN